AAPDRGRSGLNPPALEQPQVETCAEALRTLEGEDRVEVVAPLIDDLHRDGVSLQPLGGPVPGFDRLQIYRQRDRAALEGFSPRRSISILVDDEHEVWPQWQSVLVPDRARQRAGAIRGPGRFCLI